MTANVIAALSALALVCVVGVAGSRRVARPLSALVSHDVLLAPRPIPAGIRGVLDRVRRGGTRDLRDGLPEVATSLAAGMRAGLSLPQAIAFTADEVPEPMASSLRGLVDRASMGTPFGEALSSWAAGLGEEPEYRLFASVLALHRRSGGELSTVLDRLAEALSERRAASTEARSLTVQARLSGTILGLLPVGFLGFLTLLSPGEMLQTLRSPAGVVAMVTGLTLDGLAFLWIRSLLRVEA